MVAGPDLGSIRKRILRARRNTLLVGGVAGLGIAVVSSSSRGLLMSLMALTLGVLGWPESLTTKHAHLLVVGDLVGALSVWYLARDVAGLEFLTALAVAMGVFLLPLERSGQLVAFVLGTELLRTLLAFTGGRVDALQMSDTGAVIDFLIGAVVRIVVMVGGVLMLTGLTAAIQRVEKG